MRDPAFLFYYRDFKSATESMTNTARGAYIQLLCHQAEKGYITDNDMKKICSDIDFVNMKIIVDEKTYLQVKEKFMETEPESGRFINVRLSEEIEKRVKYSESRRKNRASKIENTYDITYDSTHEKHMSIHMVNANANRNINTNKEGVQGEKKPESQKAKTKSQPPTANRSRPESPEEVAAFFKSDPHCMLNGRSDPEAHTFWDYYTGNGWKVGRNPMADWRATARNWARKTRAGTYSPDSPKPPPVKRVYRDEG